MAFTFTLTTACSEDSPTNQNETVLNESTSKLVDKSGSRSGGSLHSLGDSSGSTGSLGDSRLGTLSPDSAASIYQWAEYYQGFLSAGYHHYCYISRRGILCDGFDGDNRLDVPDYYRLAKASWVDAGFDHTCAIFKKEEAGRSNLVCWGAETTDLALPTEESTTLFEKVSAGNKFTCAIKKYDDDMPEPTETNLVCWGNNNFGQIDIHPDYADSKFNRVSAGDRHACAILASRTAADESNVLCWGRDDFGQSTPPTPLFLAYE